MPLKANLTLLPARFPLTSLNASDSFEPRNWPFRSNALVSGSRILLGSLSFARFLPEVWTLRSMPCRLRASSRVPSRLTVASENVPDSLTGKRWRASSLLISPISPERVIGCPPYSALRSTASQSSSAVRVSLRSVRSNCVVAPLFPSRNVRSKSLIRMLSAVIWVALNPPARFGGLSATENSQLPCPFGFVSSHTSTPVSPKPLSFTSPASKGSSLT